MVVVYYAVVSKNLKFRISKSLFNKFLRIFLTLLTLFLFAYYFSQNKAEFNHLRGLSARSIILIALGQIIILASNVFILIELLKILTKKIDIQTSSRVVAYSSLINFFGFLQGGLGFRAVYLKKYFRVSYKTYTAITILQYASVFGVSIFLLFLGFWLIGYSIFPLLVSIVLFLLFVIFKRQILTFLDKTRFEKISSLVNQHMNNLFTLIVLSVLLFFGSALAYGAELSAVGAHVSLGALLVFTGVAQFAILIALTPGAIGIRESLLFLVQGIMGISTSSIILAGTIDRVIYFLILLLITPFAIGFKRRLGNENGEFSEE